MQSILVDGCPNIIVNWLSKSNQAPSTIKYSSIRHIHDSAKQKQGHRRYNLIQKGKNNLSNISKDLLLVFFVKNNMCEGKGEN